MDETELRRRALESMLKNKHGKDKSDGAGREDGEVEDGEVGTTTAATAQKSKWAGDDGQDATPPDGTPPDAKRAKVETENLSPSRQPTPTDSPGAAALPPPANAPPADVPKSKSKWAEDDENYEEKPLTAAKPPSAQPAVAKPPSAKPSPVPAPKPNKSKWADDDSDEDQTAPKIVETVPAKLEDKDVLAEARGQGDATSALDMLEDRLGKRIMSQATGDGGSAGGEEVDKGDEVQKDDDGMEPSEPVEPYNTSTECLELHRCRDVDKAYQKLNKIDEGTYGVVYRAKCRKTDKIVALKQVKLERAREGFPLTALRELTVLLALRHVNIVHVIEVVVSPKKQVFMAMEYMEHDFRALMESMKTPFRTPHVKCLMRQLLAGVEFMHRHWVIHRDIKTSNLLLDNRGQLKICDFGLARKYRDPIAAMTPEVVTLWYRAPELLYGEKKYDTKIDMWSVGCIFAELLLHKPLMQGKNEQDQRDKICELLGTPDEESWPNFSLLPGAKHVRYKKKQSVLREKIPLYSYTGDSTLSDRGYELLKGLLAYDPVKRLSARESLEDKIGYFDEAPKACIPEGMPTWPSTHELPKGQKKRARSRKRPFPEK